MVKIKTPTKKQWKNIGIVVAIVALVVAGVAGTLGYQKFISDTKAQGVLEYKSDECTKYMNEDKSAVWLECEATRIENNS